MPKALFNLENVDEWITQIDKAIKKYEETKQRLLPKLKEAMDKGITSRQLCKITGISHATICRWVNEFRKSEKNDA